MDSRKRSALFACLVFSCWGGVSAFGKQGIAAPPNTGQVISLLSVGGKPNDLNFNNRQPFQTALKALANMQGGGTLSIPAGDYFVDYPDIANDIDRRDPSNHNVFAEKKLTRDKLIFVPSNARIAGEVDSSGNLLTRIHWKVTSVPLFSFINASYSGITNVAFVFDGTQPHFFPWSSTDYFDAVGTKMGAEGGPYNLSAVIYTSGSEHLKFDHLTFASSAKPHDNGHTFAIGIISYGKDPDADYSHVSSRAFAMLPMGGEIPVGGPTACTTGNSYTNLNFADFVTGIAVSAQCNPVLENISGNYRGSWYRSFDPLREKDEKKITWIGPPGHLIYFPPGSVDVMRRTPTHPNGERVYSRTVYSSNIAIRNITEGAETLSNYNSIGTLALKAINGGVVENVSSQHPRGLIQIMTDTHNLTLRNLTWTTSVNPCADPLQEYCNVPAIGLAPTGYPGVVSDFNDHVTFNNVTLKSPQWAAIFKIAAPPTGTPLSHDIVVDGLTIECSPALHAGQTGPQGILTVQAKDCKFTNVKYKPVLEGSQAASAPVNVPAEIWPHSNNVSIDLTVYSGHAVQGNPTVYKSVVSEHLPGNELNGPNNCTINQHVVVSR